MMAAAAEEGEEVMTATTMMMTMTITTMAVDTINPEGQDTETEKQVTALDPRGMVDQIKALIEARVARLLELSPDLEPPRSSRTDIVMGQVREGDHHNPGPRLFHHLQPSSSQRLRWRDLSRMSQ